MAMNDADETKALLLTQVAETQSRFCELMEHRLESVDVASIEKYLGLVGKMVDKLENQEKTLRQVAQEMVAESAAQVMAELAAG